VWLSVRVSEEEKYAVILCNANVEAVSFSLRLQKNTKAAADVEYPAYGITGPNKEISPTGDRRLAQSAQMYHYQHQKQQIIAMERYVPTK
jgi:hypothetical protein